MVKSDERILLSVFMRTNWRFLHVTGVQLPEHIHEVKLGESAQGRC